MLKIQVRLPLGRSRPGVLTLTDVDDAPVLPPFACLGKADSARAKKEDNPRRLVHRPYGDTPGGVYVPSKVVHFAARHKRMGRAWIPMEGAGGDALRARHGGRKGLGIHAGRGDKRLVPTFGCVRMFDRDFELMILAIGDGAVQVIIEEIDNVRE